MSKLLERVILPHIREDLLEEYVNWKVSVSFYPIGNVFYYAMYEGKTLAGGHQEHRCRHSALLQKIV